MKINSSSAALPIAVNALGEPDAPSAPGAPGLAPSSTTSVLEETREEHSPGDEERYAHYVRKEKITRSLIEGGPVVALCGKVWTPVRNPDKFPICPTCKAIYEGMKQGGSWPFGGDVPSQGK